jgi:copper homeostasis protein
MRKTMIEVCCGSVDDVIQSQAAGADRAELNSNLFHGGLTPTIGALITAKELTDIKIMTMIRPREGGFHYTDAEFKTALADAKMLLNNGSDGLVFGFLQEDGTIDTERCKLLKDLCGDRESVFHRAIDVVPDWKEAIDTLCDIGFTRVLTSGQEASAYMGANTIAKMIEYSRGRIQILPGAGIRHENVNEIIEKTGCTQVHVSTFKKCYDVSTQNNSKIYFGGMLYPPEDRFNMIDSTYIGKICSSVD